MEMNENLPLHDVDVAVLVGGLGTRLRGVVDSVPKPLAPVLGRPFLFYLLDMLALRGARSVTLCCGYKGALVHERIGTEWLGMPIHYSFETEPLGTGGAAAKVAHCMTSDHVVLMNGDSWLEPDWRSLLHALRKWSAVIALAHTAEVSRYGSVWRNMDGQICSFIEKGMGTGLGWINGGVYCFHRSLLARLPSEPSSLEKDWFPRWADEGIVGGIESKGSFLDIGTPESFAAAGTFFEQIGFAPNQMFPDMPSSEGVVPKLGTCGVVFDEKSRIVLEKRSDCGWWCLPGGRLNAGETLTQGSVREVFEETGLEIEITGFLGVFSDPRRRTVRYPDNGDLRQLVDAVVLGRPCGGELKKSAESLDVAWFAPWELPLNTVPPVIEILREAFYWSGQTLLR